MWTDELFDEIQKGDRVWYETAQGQTRFESHIGGKMRELFQVRKNFD